MPPMPPPWPWPWSAAASFFGNAPRALRFEPIDAAADVAAVLSPLSPIASVDRVDGGWRLSLADGAALEDAAQAVAAHLAPARLELIRPTLEEPL